MARLLQQVEIGRDIEDDHISERSEYMESRGMDIVDVGVRDTAGRLVGFGSIAYDGSSGEGEMGDFAVSPEHQSRGIGKAIILERLALAETLGITSLRIPNFERTNTLRSFYLEQGFRETPAGDLVRDTQSHLADRQLAEATTYSHSKTKWPNLGMSC